MPFITRRLHPTLQLSYILLLATTSLIAQTDAGIFREFEFDFSTPGARANAMGRAFVGLADEATAAYSNPAGLSVLESPEFSIEGRLNQAFYNALSATPEYSLLQDPPADSEFEGSRIAFASFSFSRNGYNFSAFFVNNLDYRRELTQESTTFTANDDERFGSAVYLNNHHVRHIQMDTLGLSISRNFGKLSLGVSLSLARLDMDFDYKTSFSNQGFYFILNTVNSEARETTTKPAYGIGLLYQLHPRAKVGVTFKRQPLFTYTESVVNSEHPAGYQQPITFKIPDSAQLGLALQPTDLWTILFDVDWTLYKQLLGDNFTQLSVPFSPRLTELRHHFDKDDYTINQDPNYRLGFEYLQPVNKNIVALRAGAFLDSDHKTRFNGVVPEDAADPFGALGVIYQMQDFLYNNGEATSNLGLTAGLGFVWHNKIQIDLAYIRSDRYNRAVFSALYRF